MSVKKIVINGCYACPYSDENCVPTCDKIGRELGWDHLEPGPMGKSIPDWCPLPDDHQPTTISHAGSSQRVAVAHGYTLLDSRTHPAPIGVKLLCYSSRLGTTVLGEYQQASAQNPYGHTGWIGMPDVPDSLKDWTP